MAALAVGKQFGVTLDEAVKAIEAYVPSNNRSQMTKTEKNTLIVDAYNANPTSMAAALENFSNVSAEVKVAMLGDMLELGQYSLTEHVAVIRSVASRGLDHTFFVGMEFIAASEAIKAEAGQIEGMTFFATSDELAQHLADNPLDGATILIKGSRGTTMEKVIPVL
jgi:UDP-N-acetylmuramoyl-tripeptide--D-alanyl-D-alanine ligase